MTDSYEEFINAFDNDDYEYWLENEATEAQKEKALNIREAPTDTELQRLEQQQIYDNRDVRRTSEIDIPDTDKDIKVYDKSATGEKETVVLSPNQQQPTVVLPEDTKPKEKKSFLSKLKSIFRRRKKK